MVHVWWDSIAGDPALCFRGGPNCSAALPSMSKSRECVCARLLYYESPLARGPWGFFALYT